MSDKFRVKLPAMWKEPWPHYFNNFWEDCRQKGKSGGWSPLQVANYELKPLGGRLITTSTQGWYLRWDDEKYHTHFVLKWS